MANALAFIGGGLLEGVGKGLAEDGKAKREAALKKLEQKGRAELEDKRQAGANKRAKAREAGFTTRAKGASRERQAIASEATTLRTGLASTAAAQRKSLAEIREEGANTRAQIAAGKKVDTTAAEDRIIARHAAMQDGIPTKETNHATAAVELRKNGYNIAAQAQEAMARGIDDLDIRRRANEFADRLVEEKATYLGTDATDFKEFGGSRVKAHASFVRGYIKKNTPARTATARTTPARTTKSGGARAATPTAMKGSGTRADPYQPTTQAELDGVKPGDFVIVNGKPFRKK